MKMIVANDIGNSETKMVVNGGKIFKQPSIIKRLLKDPDVIETDEKKAVANLLDELVVNIKSRSVKRIGTYAIGKKANQTNGTLQNINIHKGKKHQQDIPVFMTLSLIAGRAIQLYFEENQALPDDLDLNVKMSTAIPASDYNRDNALFLEERFMKDEPVLIVFVGDKQVRVNIKFDRVIVTQEGTPAIYAIASGHEEMFRHYKERYGNVLSLKEFRHKKIFHDDIGDGTTEYIYTIGPNPQLDACSGERQGVGHATEQALKMFLDQQSVTFQINRQQFMDILRDPGHTFHEEAQACMDEAKLAQVDQIRDSTEVKYTDKTLGNVDIFCVYGGGSIQFKDPLYEEMAELAESVNAKLLWIPEEYAVDLNVLGLRVLNENMFFKEG